MNLQALGARLRARRPEFRLAARITVAGLISFALAHIANLPQGYWAVFTAVLVTQASVGGSVKAAFDRLIGTLGGALYGAVVASLVPHGDPAAMAGALALSLAPLATLAAINSTFRVAPMTAIILLLGNAGVQEGPVLAAFSRTLEVGLGGIVGLIVSVTVLPARAHGVTGDTANRLLTLLAALFAMQLDGLTGPIDRAATHAQHRAIQSAFEKLEAAAEEARRERRALLTDDSDPDPVPRTLRRLYHDLVLVGRVAAAPLPAPIDAALKPALAVLSETARRFFLGVGERLARRRAPPPIQDLNGALENVLAQLREAQAGAGDDTSRLVALSFALEQLQRNCQDLTLRARDFARIGEKKAA